MNAARSRLSKLLCALVVIGCGRPASTLARWEGPLPATQPLPPLREHKSAILGVARFLERPDSMYTKRCSHPRISSWNLWRLDATNSNREAYAGGGDTDSSGVILLNNLAPGRYRVRIIAIGYDGLEKQIELREGRRATLLAQLRRLPACVTVRFDDG